MRLNAEMSFLEVCAEAIRWADEGDTPSIRPRAHSCTADVQVVGTYRSNRFSSESTNELGELKDCLRKQQVQLDAILKHLSINPSNPEGVLLAPGPVLPVSMLMVSQSACVAIKLVILQGSADLTCQACT